MSMKKRTTSRGTPVYRINRRVGAKRYESKTFYYRSARGGASTVIPLGRNWNEASKLADLIEANLSLGEWTIDEVKRRYKKRILPRAVSEAAGIVRYATIGEILDTLEEVAPGLHVSESTRQKYRYCLLLLVRRAMERENGGAMDKEEARNLPSTILAEALVSQYKQMVRKPDANVLKDESSMRTANTTIRNARGIFSSQAMAQYRTRELVLPDLSGFMHAQFFPKVTKKYRLPPTKVIEAVMAAICEGRFLGVWVA